jgi:hypothetical protein
MKSEAMNVDAMAECSPDPGSTPGTSTIKKRPVENTLRRIGIYRGRVLDYNKSKGGDGYEWSQENHDLYFDERQVEHPARRQ